MIWRWNMPQRKTDSITVTGNLMAVRNFNEIVRPVIMPLLRQQRRKVTCVRKQHITKAVLSRNNTGTLDWPANYPALTLKASLGLKYVSALMPITAEICNSSSMQNGCRHPVSL